MVSKSIQKVKEAVYKSGDVVLSVAVIASRYARKLFSFVAWVVECLQRQGIAIKICATANLAENSKPCAFTRAAAVARVSTRFLPHNGLQSIYAGLDKTP